ncbi:hypothetical protein HK103_005281 [Boothiomyces macroporosus]|uniref:N-acetyltransferase domain-containing protein n=1 Tax=Boothiomyces macroporosus TaxID=261099 RepID=A0AAD5Y5A7_9FUNG|nr:hypothetical protein HK103_000318 [Boothiomyces macroporosus]KAJ3256538.1 hypothetical protein HK103_005281 [Boothiomyces macroporosus]
MSSAYGKIHQQLNSIDHLFPLKDALKNNDPVEIIKLQPGHIDQLHALLNLIIREGKTYPFEQELDRDQFIQYFSPGFVCVRGDKVLGAFYVKPNFPGRCSHICNGGFIVEPAARGLGVAKVMCRAFLQIAPALGYKASMFNLVFENNTGSVRVWESFGFKIIGRVPKAGRLEGSDQYVDAIQYYYEFQENKVPRHYSSILFEKIFSKS